MTGSKDIVVDLVPSNSTVSYGDNTRSKVMGLGKVVVAPDISLVNVLLVETLGYNLLFIHQIACIGLCTFFDEHMVVLLWSKTLRVAFVGYVESGLYVVDFSGKITSSDLCIFAKGDVGWLWHRRLAHVNMRTLQSLHKGGHILGLKDDVSFVRIVCVRHALKERCMELLIRPRLLSLQLGAWSSYMLISSVRRLMRVLEERSIAS